jgi:hypothetical protein
MIYTIKKDTNNDTRFRIPDILTGKFKKTWKVSMSPECWYPKELGYNQINKLVGVTEFWSANNKNSVMVGWDPCYLPEAEILEKYPHCKNLTANIKEVKYFNIYYYENDAVGGHTAKLWTVIADWHINDLIVTQSTIEKNEYTLRMLETKIEIVQFSGGGIANLNTIWTVPIPFHPDYTYPENHISTYTYRTAFKFSWLREIFIWFGGTRKAPWNMLFKVN